MRTFSLYGILCCSLFSCAADSTSRSTEIFEPSLYQDRIYNTVRRSSCEEETLRQSDDIARSLSGQNEESVTVIYSRLNICNSTVQRDIPTILIETDAVDGNFLFATTADRKKWYWIFILLNDEDVTGDLLGTTNLMEVSVNSVLNIPLSGLPNVVPSVLTIYAVDTEIFESEFQSVNNIFSTRLDTTATLNHPIAFSTVSGQWSGINPYPELLKISNVENLEMDISVARIEDGSRESISLLPIDYTLGKIVDLQCGNDEELITITDSNFAATSIRCTNSSNSSLFEDVVFHYRPDAFTLNTTGTLGEFSKVFP